MKIFLRTFPLMVLGLLSPSGATDLHSAKNNKQVCELPNGDVKALTNEQAIKDLVEDVNTQRLREYQTIAQQNGTDLAVVRKAAAEEIAKNNPDHKCS